MRPVLVTKSIVKTLIEFLIANNPWYQQCGVEYSQSNMDDLFDAQDGDSDIGVPKALEICHLPKDDFVEGDGVDNPCEVLTPEDIDVGDVVLESVGFTKGDHSVASREKMKLHALAYVLDHNCFLMLQAGSQFMSDNDPGLMSFLFPQLDPWDIGGFHHCGHTVQQHISMEAQLKSLLQQDDSPFVQDSNFAFICWNMIQKKEVSTNTSFRIGASLQKNLAAELRDIGPMLTNLAEKWTLSTNTKPLSKEEKKAAKILCCLHASTRSLKGSAGYKLCRCNEIHLLMKRFSTPALFVTINLHDITSSLIPCVTGIKIKEWSTMTSFARAKVIASHPDAATIVFDLQMQSFIDIILRYKHGPGIFGHCKAYYGMVEAQGRGTLHCHFLVLITGNPSPQELRERLSTDYGFTDKMFSWLESIISCELPGDTGPFPETFEYQAKKPVCPADESDSWLEIPPQADEMDKDLFKHEFSDFLYHLVIECNWHVHNDTCFKHVKNGEKRDDATCRMHLDGSTQAISTVDPETGSIKLRRWQGRVNNFMDLILFLLQCNTDTQYIGSGEAVKVTVFYTTEYITKCDLLLHVGLQALDYATKMHLQNSPITPDVASSQKDCNLITKSVNAMMGRQEMSHQQIMSYLVGGGDYYSSHTFQMFKWFDFVKAIERMEHQTTQENDVIDDNDEEIINSVNNEEQVSVSITHDKIEFSGDFADYALHPTDLPFSDLCLWEFMENCIKKRGKILDAEHSEGEESDINDKEGSCVKKRGRKCLPRASFASGHPL
jgi:hypothetical protein